MSVLCITLDVSLFTDIFTTLPSKSELKNPSKKVLLQQRIFKNSQKYNSLKSNKLNIHHICFCFSLFRNYNLPHTFKCRWFTKKNKQKKQAFLDRSHHAVLHDMKVFLYKRSLKTIWCSRNPITDLLQSSVLNLFVNGLTDARTQAFKAFVDYINILL